MLKCILLFVEDNLYKLETAMRTKGYQLFVERESSSFGALEVGNIKLKLFTERERDYQ